MVRIIWTEPALLDLNEIAEYIAIENRQAAKNLVSTVFEKVKRLADFPLSGRMLSELDQLGYREVIVNPCRVIYKVDQQHVYVLFVIRQEQDLRRFMLDH